MLQVNFKQVPKVVINVTNWKIKNKAKNPNRFRISLLEDLQQLKSQLR